MVVRVSACDSVLHLVDDTGFYADMFVPHLESAFGGLFALLDQCQEVDTKLRILNVISIVMVCFRLCVRVRYWVLE